MPWFGLSLFGNGGIKPCCEYNKFIYNFHHDPPPPDFYNQHDFLKLRQDFLKGKRPPGCQRCWEHEEQTGGSERINFNKIFLPLIRGSYVFRERLREPQWQLVDISFSNICNLKCRMCGIWGSMRWLDDEKKLSQLSADYNKESRPDYFRLTRYTFNDFKFLLPLLKNIKFIQFKGGEPFLDPNHIKFLKYLISKNLHRDIFLRYTTNGTFINDDILRILSYFKRVSILVSVEVLGKLYRYIRGGDYSFETAILKNVIRFIRLPNVDISFNSAVQAYNILKLADLYKYLNNLDIRGVSADHAFCSLVHSPAYLGPFILPRQLRQLACERMRGIKEFDSLRKKLLASPEDEANFTVFRRFTKDLDKIRNENVLDVIPELKNYW